MRSTAIGAILLFAAFAFFSLRPSTALWSLSSGADLPAVARAAWILLGALALASAFLLPKTERASSRAGDFPLLGRARRLGPIPWVLLSALLLFLFLAMRSRNHFLGDGWLVVTLLERDSDPIVGRPGMGTLLVHRFLFRLIRGHGVGEERVFAVLSSAAGVVYVLLALRWARVVQPIVAPRRPAAALLLAAPPLTIGTMQLFFGYVENYALAHLFLFAFLVEGSLCLARRRSPLLATPFFALMALSHWATVALLPALLFLWMEREGRIFARLPRRLPEIGAALVFLLPTTLSEARLFYIAQPWTAHGGYAPYGILSKAYLLLRANFALLLVPVPILLFLFRLGEPGRTGEGAPPLLRFLRTAALSAIAESAAIRAFLGPCDWDLFSFFAGPVALWAAARAATRAREEDLRPLALLAAAVGLFTLAPWVIGNTSVEGGAKRVARMVHDDPQHYVGRKPRAVALAWVMAERGAPETAFALFRHVAEKRPDNAIARADLGILYFQRGMYREAAPHLEEAVRLDPSLDPPLYYLGAVRFHMKEGDFGEDALRRFLDRVPGNPSAESYLGRVLLLDARWEEALGHLLGAYRALPGNADLNAWIALALVRLGRIDEARSHVERALRTDPDHADARRLLDEVRDGGGGSGATRPRGGR